MAGERPGRARRRSLHVSDAEGGGGAEVVFRATMQAAIALGDETAQYVGGESRSPLSYVFSWRHYVGMRRKLREFRPDVVHLHNYYHFLSPSILLALRHYRRTRPDCRVIFTAHDYHLVCPNSGLRHVVDGVMQNYDAHDLRFSLRDRFDDRSALHSALKLIQHVVAYRILGLRDVLDTVISPSYFLRDVFQGGGVETPIEVVRNPVALPEPDVDSGSGSGLVYLGRIVPEKGVIEFVRSLEQSGSRVSLDVFGSGEDSDKLMALRGELEYVNLTLHGAVDHGDVPATLRRYRALVHASRWYENAPVAIVEAAAQGLEVVVCAGGGGEEMSMLAKRQHIFEQDSVESIAAAVASAAASTGKNEIIDPSEFSAETYARRIDQIYA